MQFRLSLIRGDGIGPEIVAEAKRVLDRVFDLGGHSVTYSEVLLGGASVSLYSAPRSLPFRR